MVHPAVYAALVVGGVVVVGLKLYEEYKEAKMYEQYQRHRTRYEQEQQQYNHFQHRNNEFDDSDDDNNLRRRRPFSKQDQNSSSSIEHDQYELSELETSIAERKRKLMAEQAFLDQEEENLRNRKNILLRSCDDVTSTSLSNFINSNSSSDNGDDDDHSLHNHMTQFDRSQETSEKSLSRSVENTSDSTETLIHNKVPLQNSTELFYPAASLTPTTPTTSTTSTTNSVTSHINRISDSEESWDTVSEAEWNQSSANESDNEHSSHHSIASLSDGENRIHF